MTEDELKAIEAHAKMRTERAWACVTCQDCGIDAEDVLALVAEVRRLHVRLEDKERSLADATRDARRRQWNDG